MRAFLVELDALTRKYGLYLQSVDSNGLDVVRLQDDECIADSISWDVHEDESEPRYAGYLPD